MLKLRLLSASNPGFTVLASSAVADGTVIAIAANTLVAAADPVPTFDVSENATIVLDTAPAQIGVAGSMAAGATRGLFQTDSIGLRVRLGASWALRSATGISWLQNVIW
jgi:hypothetical protein